LKCIKLFVYSFTAQLHHKFWISAYKSYPMIGVKVIKTILPFELHGSVNMDFPLWQKLKA